MKNKKTTSEKQCLSRSPSSISFRIKEWTSGVSAALSGAAMYLHGCNLLT